LIQQQLREVIAKEHNILMNKRTLEHESARFDRETMAPEILDRVKKIFSENRDDYLKHYVRPILVERLLQEKFLFDTLYHKEPYKKVKEASNKIKGAATITDTVVKVFEPGKELLPYYENALGKGICEDKYSYYFVNRNEKRLIVYLVPKNDYTEWFQTEALKIKVEIYDKKLKEKLLLRTKDSVFWQKLLQD